MTTIRIPGVIDVSTKQYMAAPSFEPGDVTISVGGEAFIPTLNVPALAVPGSGSPIVELELASSEFVDSAIIQFGDLDKEWIGPTIFDVTGDPALSDSLNQIIAALTPPPKKVVRKNSSSFLQLTRGDYETHTFDAGENIDSAERINFTVRDENDKLLIDQDTTGVDLPFVGQIVTLTINSLASAQLSVSRDHKFDVEVYWSAEKRKTIANGVCEVEEDQSR